MNKFSKYVGLDVHQETIAVAVADIAGEVRYAGEIVNTPEALAKLVAQLKRGSGRLSFCYEHPRLALPQVPERHDDAAAMPCASVSSSRLPPDARQFTVFPDR